MSINSKMAGFTGITIHLSHCLNCMIGNTTATVIVAQHGQPWILMTSLIPAQPPCTFHTKEMAAPEWFCTNASSGIPTPHTYTMEPRSEEHTSELQSRGHLVCRLLLEKKETILFDTS